MMRILSVVFVLLLTTRSAEAVEVRRFGLLVGSNRGFAGERELQFAEQDARRMANVLRNLGGVPPEDLVVIQGGRAAQVQHALISLNTRVREAVSQGHDTVLFVYYSGHGDASELHLGPTGLSVADLRNMVAGSPATFRVLIVDSCRSGGLTGIKGAVPTPTFRVTLEDRLPSEGFAVITSASMDEEAQESARWGGSIFTAMLISGLSGAADVSGDGTVTLHEAYQYAFEQTLSTTRSTVPGPQHPTFEYDLKGKGSIPLTTTHSLGGAWGALEIGEPGSYFLVQPNGTFVLEVSFQRGARRVMLAEGTYGIERRARDHLLIGQVVVYEGHTTPFSSETMRRVEYAQAVRKGGTEHGSVLAIGAAWAVSARRAAAIPATHGVALDMDLHLASVTIGLAVETGFVAREGELDGAVRVIAPAAALSAPIDLGPLTFSVGIEAGLAVIWEQFEPSVRTTPDRVSAAAFLGPAVGMDWRIAGPLELRVRGALRPQLLREQTDRAPDSDLRLTVAPSVSVGLGWLTAL